MALLSSCGGPALAYKAPDGPPCSGPLAQSTGGRFHSHAASVHFSSSSRPIHSSATHQFKTKAKCAPDDNHGRRRLSR
jgi:hypothetical protein